MNTVLKYVIIGVFAGISKDLINKYVMKGV